MMYRPVIHRLMMHRMVAAMMNDMPLVMYGMMNLRHGKAGHG